MLKYVYYNFSTDELAVYDPLKKGFLSDVDVMLEQARWEVWYASWVEFASSDWVRIGEL